MGQHPMPVNATVVWKQCRGLGLCVHQLSSRQPPRNAVLYLPKVACSILLKHDVQSYSLPLKEPARHLRKCMT